MQTNSKRKLAELFPEGGLFLESFKCLFGNSFDAVFVLDRQGKVLAVNRRAKELTKRNSEFYVGKSFKQIVPAEILPPAKKAFSTLIKGKSKRFELEFKTTTQKTVAIEATVMPFARNKKTVAILGVVRDITTKKDVEKKLRESEERYRNLIETLPEAVYTISKDGKIASLNSMFEKITGWPRKEWIGKSFAPLVHPDDLPLAIKSYKQVLKGKALPPYELRIRSRSGEYVVGEFMSRPYIEDGKIIGEFGIVRDVTEHKKFEEALRSSEAKSRTLFENVPDGVFQSTPKGRVLTANPALVHMLGYSSLEDLRTINISRDLYVNPEDRKTWMKKLNKESMVRNAELVLRRKNGQKLIALENSHAVRDERGRIVHFEGTLTDITERKVLEERLSALNHFASKINLAQTLEQVYEMTLTAIEQALGFGNAAFMVVEKGRLRCAYQSGFIEQDMELPLDGSKKGVTVKVANTCKPVVLPDVTKDKDYVEGMPGTLSEIAVPIEVEGKIYGVLDVESMKLGAFSEKDVLLLQILASHTATAISNLEKRQEIEKRSSQFALLMKISAEMIHSTDLRRRLQKVAEAIREYGWRRVVIRAVRGQNMELTNPEDMVTAGLSKEEIEFLWNNRVPGQVWRERFGSEYERFKVCEFYHLPWSDPWVRKRFSQGTVESKLSSEEMVDWNPEDLLYAPLRLADGRIVGILSIDDPIDGKRPTKETLAPLELFIHQAAVAIENAQLIQQLNKAKNQIREYANQLELKVKERTEELIEAQNKLVKTERLAAIGEVAAMVGHDLRNPLTGIAGASYYLKTKLGSKADDKTREMFELIEKDIEYSNKIINDLLDYSREMQLELRTITPQELVKEAITTIKIPENIKISNQAKTEPWIKVDIRKMQRVFINIIKNAADAMPNGGKLTIETNTSKHSLQIAFTDTGLGMSKEIQKKLWSPFFTTKAKGMGLGLAICKRIVEAHKGKISLKSNVGKGTKFMIIVPLELEPEKGGENVWVNLPESLLSTMMKA